MNIEKWNYIFYYIFLFYYNITCVDFYYIFQKLYIYIYKLKNKFTIASQIFFYFNVSYWCPCMPMLCWTASINVDSDNLCDFSYDWIEWYFEDIHNSKLSQGTTGKIQTCLLFSFTIIKYLQYP